VIASAGSLDTATGTVHYAANLPFSNYPLARRLSARTQAPVFLIGDATAATVAEFTTGAGAGQRHGLYITVSTGVGMGVVADGRLLRGASGQAGDLGHVPVVSGPQALPCGCGQRGCLEVYASGRGLQTLSAQRETSTKPLTPPQILAAARAGDVHAKALVSHALDLLATAVAGAIRLLAPEVVVLGGGLLLAGGLAGPLRKRAADILTATMPHIRDAMVPAAHGRFSSLYGAAMLARDDPSAVTLLGHRLEGTP
jgi:predicted NBD/HSP70 family sugar kinase